MSSMSGRVSSLGIGSGVLTADVIDQLRKVDENAMIAPITRNIEFADQRKEAYSLLTSLMTTFKTSTSALSFDTIFDNKEVNISGDARVSIGAGISVDSFTLETVELAKRDITKLGAIADRNTTRIAESSGTLRISRGSENFDIAYNATMNLSDLAQAITDAGGDVFSASILQTGSGAFNLVISSRQTGEQEALTLTDSSENLNAALFAPASGTNPGGFEKVQTASNAEFKYNGITITRPTNSFSDLISGVSMTLGRKGDFSNVNISLDKAPIIDEMKLLVESYNALISNLRDMTISDMETGNEGVFNRDSFIKSLSRELSSMMTMFKGSDSLVNYGIELSRDGTMSFNSRILDKKLESDAQSVRNFFTGTRDDKGNLNSGIFNLIDERVSQFTAPGKLLSNFSNALDTESSNFARSLERAQESLESRYASMASRFAAYDAMINRINIQFSSLRMIIDQAASKS